MSYRRSNLLPHAEERLVLSSFLSSNNERECFGRFRIPKSFDDEFGKLIPKRLRFICNMIEWKGNYDRKLKRIYGLGNFMEYYEIKIYGSVQFDYYGEDEFRVRIFKNTAIEPNYRKMSPTKFFNGKKHQNWKDEEYFIEGTSLHYQKASALWSFNAFMNYVDYFEMKINNVHIDHSFPYLRLSKEFEKLYKDWEDGGQVYLRLGEKTWDINVQWIGNTCGISQRWYAFVEECELEVGDTLVLFRIPLSEPNTVNVCLFKGKEQSIDDGREKVGVLDRSFLKVVSAHFLVEGVMFVPKTIKDKYGQKLCCINKLQIFGEMFNVSYNYNGGYLSQFDEVIQRFNLKVKDTVVFTMNESNVMHARIYQMDGKEIEYDNRSVEHSDDSEVDWIWSIHWIPESDTEEESVEEAKYVENLTVSNNMINANLMLAADMNPPDLEHNDVIELDVEMNNPAIGFSAIMSKCNVNNTSHGPYIPGHVKPHNRKWRAGEHVFFRIADRAWDIGVVYSGSLARFSAGWNKFARDEELKINETVVFNLLEGEEELVFEIEFPLRS